MATYPYARPNGSAYWQSQSASETGINSVQMDAELNDLKTHMDESFDQDLRTTSIPQFAGFTFGVAGAVRTSTSAGNTLIFQAYDVDGASYSDFITLTAANTPTCDLDVAVTHDGNIILNTGAAVTFAQGGTGQATQQAAIDALTAISGAFNEYILTKDTATGNATWKAAASGFADPMTTQGDVIIRTGAGTDRLALGTSGKVLKSDGTDITWDVYGSASETVEGVAKIATQILVDAGVDDSTMLTPLKLLNFPGLVRKNLIINGNFRINQRGYLTTAVLAASAYAHDRWRDGGAGTAAYSFTQLPNSTTITLTAGTLEQVVEDKNVAGGVYTLSWTGTATARVGISGAVPSGAYAASPITTASAGAGQTITIEFLGGATLTIGEVQLEVGSVATPFEHRHIDAELASCQRYYERLGEGAAFTPQAMGAAYATNTAWGLLKYSEKRTTPTSIAIGGGGTLRFRANNTNYSMTSVTFQQLTSKACRIEGVATGAVQGHAGTIEKTSGTTTFIEIDAEL